MSFVRDRLDLRIGTRAWRAWSKVHVTESIEQLCTSAALSLSRIDRSAHDWIEPVPGDACTINIGVEGGAPSLDRLVLTGHIDSDEDDTASGSAYECRIRSRIADCVDCSHRHKTGVIKGAKVEQIAAELFTDGYGIAVRCEVDTGPVVPLVRAKRTDTPYGVLVKLAKERGLLLRDNAAGDLVITTVVGPGRHVATLERGKNVLSMSRQRDVTGRYLHYRVRGQSADDFAAEASVMDLWSGLRNRLLVVDADKIVAREDCERRALWEAMTRAGKSIGYTATVRGWRVDPTNPASDLWRANTLVHAIDPFYRLDDDLVISKVERVRGAGEGTRSVLTLVYPDGLTPEPRRYKRAGKQAGKRDGNGVDWFAGVKYGSWK